jgi:fatty-acyl-CoA synthase
MSAAARLADHTLGGWLPARASLTPGRVAIDFGGREISYHDLAGAAARRAAAFAAAGRRPGDRVAVLARNCPEQVELFFACALRALIMVPLNWRLTPAELAYQIRDAGPAVLLAAQELMPLASAAAAQAGLPHLATALTSADGLPAAEVTPDGPARDDDPLLILYTSGTTGRPKGAMLTHANCFWTNVSLDQTAEITADDVVLQVLPQCHVAGWNVQPLLAWWKGARVVLEQAFDAARTLALISRCRVTTMMGVPTNYLMLAGCAGFGGADLSSLRRVIAGGAPMPLPLIETWQARGVTVLQGYGLTEAAPNVLCVPAQDARRKAGSAGRPYPHPAVAEAAVIGVGDERWGETGLAFVVARDGQQVQADDLAGFCRTRLAGYKVPRRYRFVAELPRLTSGKVDKLALARGQAEAAGSGPAAGQPPGLA